MKTCTKCKITKELSEFGKDNQYKSGVKNFCKQCNINKTKEYNRTKKGLIAKINKSQKANSKAKGREAPLYNDNTFREWLSNDWVFDLLYTNWKNLGFCKDLIPSIDRIDDSKGYSFDNIQLMTWGENNSKGFLTNNNFNQIGREKKVAQYTRDKKLIKIYSSGKEAADETKVKKQSISHCCRKHKNYSHAGGFIWEFV